MEFFGMGNDGAVIRPPQVCNEPLNIFPENYVGKIYKKGKNIDAVKSTIDKLPDEFNEILYYKENYKCTINEIPQVIPTRYRRALSDQQLILRYVEGYNVDIILDEYINRNNDCDYFKLLIASIKTYYAMKELADRYKIFYNDFSPNNMIYNENTNKLMLIDLDTITYDKPKGLAKIIYRNEDGTYKKDKVYFEGDLAYPYWDKEYVSSIIKPILLSMTNALSLSEQDIVDVGETNKTKFLNRKTVIENILGKPIIEKYSMDLEPTDIDKFNLEDLYNKFCNITGTGGKKYIKNKKQTKKNNKRNNKRNNKISKSRKRNNKIYK